MPSGPVMSHRTFWDVEMFCSMPCNARAMNYLWLLSSCNRASMIEELTFHFYFINLNLKSNRSLDSKVCGSSLALWFYWGYTATRISWLQRWLIDRRGGIFYVCALDLCLKIKLEKKSCIPPKRYHGIVLPCCTNDNFYVLEFFSVFSVPSLWFWALVKVNQK